MWFVAPGQDPWTRALLDGWTQAGLDVVLHELDDPQDAAGLRDAFAAAGRSIAAGFSAGARMIVQAEPELAATGIVCVGFPFHRRHDPQDTHGLDALRAVTTPTLILQGTRDPHGTREQVASYGSLPSCVQMHWIEDGNHRLRPRERLGLDLDGQRRTTTARVLEFVAAARTP